MSYSIHLFGDNWASRSVGYLAVEIIAGLTLIACLIFVRSFRWVYRGTTDRLRTYIFVTSTVALIVYFILDLTTLGEDEHDAVVGIGYYVLFIFIELFYRIAEFTILFVVVRTVNSLAFTDHSDANARHRILRILSVVLLSIVGLVTVITFSLVASFYGLYANAEFYQDNLVNTIIGFFVAYNTMYLITALYTIGIAVLGAVRQRSRASFIMLIVTFGLTLRTVIFLADTIAVYYDAFSIARFNLDWADSYIYNVMVIVVYAGVTAVAVFGSGFEQMLKHDPGQELAPFAEPHVYE